MVHSVFSPGADNALPPQDPTIAELLKPLGYATGMVGKWCDPAVARSAAASEGAGSQSCFRPLTPCACLSRCRHLGLNKETKSDGLYLPSV